MCSQAAVSAYAGILHDARVTVHYTGCVKCRQQTYFTVGASIFIHHGMLQLCKCPLVPSVGTCLYVYAEAGLC